MLLNSKTPVKERFSDCFTLKPTENRKTIFRPKRNLTFLFTEESPVANPATSQTQHFLERYSPNPPLFVRKID